MKKTVIIEILLLFVFCVALACAIKILDYAVEISKTLEHFINRDIDYMDDVLQNESIKYYTELYHSALSYGIPALFAAVADLIVMAIIAIKDFPAFRPLLNRLTAFKEQRAAAKVEQAEVAKQERIAALQAELDELKGQTNDASLIDKISR